jgi:Na+/H+-dicarboxylate symporter
MCKLLYLIVFAYCIWHSNHFTAPVPSSALVLIITAYNTVFNTTGTPAGFEYVLAIDWFMDRLITVLNVTGDSVVSAVVTALVEESELPEDPPTKHIAAESDGSSANGEVSA